MNHEGSSKVTITNTSSLEGWRINSYLGVVSCHVVAGTGVFSDIAAGFSDFFGGRSESYRRQLESIDTEAIAELTSKAQRLGANALLGLRIDHDEISGKDKQMFMCTAQATAVLATPTGDQSAHSTTAAVHIEAGAIKLLNQRKHILKRLESSENECPSPDDWKFIGMQRAPEFLPWIFEKLANPAVRSKAVFPESFVKDSAGFISIFPIENIRGLICRAAAKAKNPDNLIYIIDAINLVDFDAVQELLSSPDAGQAKFGAVLMKSQKASYTPQDLTTLIAIRDKIENRFQRVAPVSEARGIFGKKAVWKCPACQTSVTEEFQRCACGCDVFGFSAGSCKEEILTQLDNRITLLRELLSS